MKTAAEIEETLHLSSLSPKDLIKDSYSIAEQGWAETEKTGSTELERSREGAALVAEMEPTPIQCFLLHFATPH